MIDKIKENKWLAGIIAAALLAVAVIASAVVLSSTIKHGGSASIEYSDEQRKASITLGEDDTINTESEEYGLGEAGEEVEKDDIPTVEEIDAEGPVMDDKADDEQATVECPEGEECGLGAYIWAPTETPSAFKNYVLGKCLNTDGAYGAQCWDEADVFWQNVASRRAQTCGTGAAKGMIQDGCWQKNAGDEFIMIWDATQLQAGDWVIFTNGKWGHVGMALGTYNNGYVTLLGQNQGGTPCPGGGSAGNIVNISLKNFGGAFRYKKYEEARIAAEQAKRAAEEAARKAQEDASKPQTSKDSYVVKKGDTLGSIALKMGWYINTNGLFGDDGYTQKLAEKNGIVNRGLIFPNQVIKEY